MNKNSIAMRLPWTLAWLAGHFLAAVVVLFVLLKVVPQFTKIFKDFDAALPATTKMVILLSMWMSHYWWLAFAVGFIVDAWILLGLRCLPPGGQWLSTLWGACILMAAILLLGTIVVAVFVPLVALLEALT